jgi:peptidoglycan LD-endopeptidase CwlK
MPNFSASSLEKLATIDPRLRALLRELILDIDFTIVYGRRGKKEQDEAFRLGNSRVRWPDSKHNVAVPASNIPREHWPEDPNGLSLAVDIAPYPIISWKDEKQFTYLAGALRWLAKERRVPLRYGGDWDGDWQGVWRDPSERGALSDLGHFELWEPEPATTDLPSPRIATPPKGII